MQGFPGAGPVVGGELPPATSGGPDEAEKIFILVLELTDPEKVRGSLEVLPSLFAGVVAFHRRFACKLLEPEVLTQRPVLNRYAA